MNSKDKGEAGEKAAVRFMRKNGYKILERNFASALGEIDIVALDGDVLCFVEVKTRLKDSHGEAIEALTSAKQRQVTKTALAYLKSKRLEDVEIRFDFAAVGSEPDGRMRVTITKGAFLPRELGRNKH